MSDPTVTRTLTHLRRRLERAELDHLRQLAVELQAKLDEALSRAAYAEESAEFWHDNALNLQEAINSEEGVTHRAIGMNKAGELMVVRLQS